MTDQQQPSNRASAWSAWGLSAINGIVGDYLHARGNGLAIDTAFYHQDRPLPLMPERLAQSHPLLTAKVCVLVHGLGCNEGVWAFQDPRGAGGPTSYGALLQAERGYTPFYVRYNTGLAVAESGRRLAMLLDELLAVYPVPVDEIVMIGHSMGGLVLRSACHYGARHGSAWVQRVARVFYLGTPHDGAGLEKLVHVATTVLRALPNPITRIVGNALNLRSQGVKDLRFGTLLEPDVLDDTPEESTHHRRAVPWLPHARHYLIGGALADDPEHAANALFGDGLVGAPSAAAAAARAGAAIPPEHVRLFPGTHHFQLACDWEVYQQISAWCAPA